jgi:COX assembly protein 2
MPGGSYNPVEDPNPNSVVKTHSHSAECELLMQALKDCHEQHKFRKFIGFCNDANTALVKCFKKDRIQRQKENYAKSKQMQEKIRRVASPKE